jgi:hypothetical protein
MKPKALKLTFDLSDKPELVELLKAYSLKQKQSQREVVIKALEAFFADRLENKMLLRAAEQTFAEWDNPEDEVYNDL